MHRPIMVDFVYELSPLGEPTLRLAFENVAVLDVESVGYGYKPLAIHRHQLSMPIA